MKSKSNIMHKGYNLVINDDVFFDIPKEVIKPPEEKYYGNDIIGYFRDIWRDKHKDETVGPFRLKIGEGCWSDFYDITYGDNTVHEAVRKDMNEHNKRIKDLDNKEIKIKSNKCRTCRHSVNFLYDGTVCDKGLKQQDECKDWKISSGISFFKAIILLFKHNLEIRF